jgi:hypothetical protein
MFQLDFSTYTINPIIFLVERFQTKDQNSAIQELSDTGIKLEDFVLEAKLIMKILQKYTVHPIST